MTTCGGLPAPVPPRLARSGFRKFTDPITPPPRSQGHERFGPGASEQIDQEGGPPVDVSEFNEAFALIEGKGPLEDAVRGLYGNNKVVDVHHFPRRLLHSVMYPRDYEARRILCGNTCSEACRGNQEECRSAHAFSVGPERRSAHASETGMARENKKTLCRMANGKRKPFTFRGKGQRPSD